MKIRPAVVILEDDKLLTMHYQYGGQDVFNLPGGNLEYGEMLTTALERELEEELGIKAQIGELLMVGEVHFSEHQKQCIHFIFEGKITAGTPALNPEHTSAIDIRWVDIADLGTLHLYPNVSASLQTHLAGKLTDKYVGKLEQTWF
ncbi:NUDIX domain-containing protein [Emticicia sp. TH156]|uniref:NUDIX domain-containing protein n=1 Tax=Emticicia sp. TH156 TaxID=2067454 RepID=UPI000C76D4BA|nr:NUDIX domain-containing protein [Emticicia sp. TH156]PLK42397.1 NUDIX hydrolase [Emticicia sp. TH156]